MKEIRTRDVQVVIKKVDCGSGQIRLAFSSDKVPTQIVHNWGKGTCGSRADRGLLVNFFAMNLGEFTLNEVFNEVLLMISCEFWQAYQIMKLM